MTGSGMELGPGGVIITFKRVPYTVFCAQLESLNLSNRCRVLIAQLGITFVYVATEQIELDRSSLAYSTVYRMAAGLKA